MYEENERKPQHSWMKVIALLLAVAVLAGAAGGTMGYVLGSRPTESAEPARLEVESAETTAPAQPAPIEATTLADQGLGLAPAKNEMLTPADVYERNVNAVVAINIEGTKTNVWGQISAYAASGSGFIITTDGYVVTNNHVISGASTINVTLTSGDTYPAELIGCDEENDVALLKIEADGLPVVSIGDSETLHVGDMVAAIGNPLGELTNTLTVGYVSALNREINIDGTPMNMMQTDAAINSGNSGGPLFDMYGNVVGITTAKYASSSVEGLGFSIPINDAMYIVYDLYEYGYVTSRPWLGVQVKDLDSVTASYYSLPVGVYVGAVNEGSAAAKAGVEDGDIIIGLGDTEVANYNELSGAMRKFHAGDTTTITVYRAGAELELTITFDEKQPEQLTEPEVSEDEPDAGRDRQPDAQIPTAPNGSR